MSHRVIRGRTTNRVETEPITPLVRFLFVYQRIKKNIVIISK